MAEEKKGGGEKLIASNPTARSNYVIEEVVEAGIVLTGTEVKSLRSQTPALKDSYVEVTGKGSNSVEAWLLNTHIGPYTHGNIWNHEPSRRRKLLLHRHQLEKLHGATIKKGITIVPTKMYFKKGMVKVELALGKGKKKGDKREDVKKKSAQREMDRAMKSKNSR
ncbi:SsrA-binding protein SmpB [bacterium]|jgi:SsrA-binding protein|nr:SsrA-binding protein SmpB [bacterium]